MDYQRIYIQLIDSRRAATTSDTYHECHHIIPLSEGGIDNEGNIVKLTAREHYIAHLLLMKIYDDFAMHAAVVFMQTGRHQGRDFKFNSHLYDKIRRRLGEKQKGFIFSEDTRKKISEALKGRHLSDETRKKISETRKGYKFSKETRKKLSEALKGRKFTAEHCKKLSVLGKGRHWWNNGVTQTMAFECPEGFVSGRLR